MDAHSPFLRPDGMSRRANYHDHGLRRYSRFFKSCPHDRKIMLEATPHYMYQRTALDVFAVHEPQPHIIFALRNPSRRIFSHFCYAKYNLARLKSTFSFHRFVEMLLSRENDKIKSQINGIYPELTFHWLTNQLRYSRYYEHLVRWADFFPENHLHIILFEKMAAAPRATVRHLVNSVDIDGAFYDQFNFDRTNPTRGVKYLSIHRWYFKNLGRINSFFRGLAFLGLTIDYKDRYLRFQGQRGYPEEPDPISLQRLDDYFRPHNRYLEKAFHLDLGCWRG